MTTSTERNIQMTRFKDFGAGSDTVAAEPLSFKLYGETFECLPKVQGKLLLDLVSETSDDDPAKQVGIIGKFFDRVLTDESMVRFNLLLNDKEKIVSVETLAEITSWLMEEYTGRPEGQPEVS